MAYAEMTPVEDYELKPRFMAYRATRPTPNHRMHVGLRHNEARGIGYDEGYTTLEAFGIYDGCGTHFMPFVDLRGHIFNNEKFAANIGIGERTFLSCLCHMFGAYLYYDVRQAGHDLTVNQLSPGFELLGRCMEYRINGYFPLGKRKSHKYGYAFDEFEDHNIFLKFKQQRALTGGDAEVGMHLAQTTRYDLYAGMGPYYLYAPHAQSWGGRARLLGRYQEYITLEAAYSYDRLFRSVVEGSIAFSIPFGCKIKRACAPQCSRLTNCFVLARAAYAPSRFEIPAVKRVHRKRRAINPATGEPWFVWFVNNTSSSDGTFESPFPTLVQAQNASAPNDMIYVFRGNGTTTGMNAGITLKDGQVFFGSGIEQPFATTKGTIDIPAFTAGNPSITNTGGIVVVIRSANVVSGFNIAASAGNDGINSGSASNGATITNNNITGLTGNSAAIDVFGVGVINIYNNQMSMAATNAGTLGIQVTASGGTIQGLISNNIATGGSSGIAVVPNTGDHDFLIEGNTVTGFDDVGIQVFLTGNSIVDIAGNTVVTNITGGRGIGVFDTASTRTSNVMIDDNQVTIGNNPISGIEVNVSLATNGHVNAAVTNNFVQSVIGGGFVGINHVALNGNTICLGLQNNTVVDPTAGAIAFGFTASTGFINIDTISGNIGGPVTTTGTGVRFVAPGTCGN
jgi:hypothetical protein